MEEEKNEMTEEQEAPKPLFTVKTTLNAELEQEASKALTPKASKYITYGCYVVSAVMAVGMFWRYMATKDTQSLLLSVVMVLVLAYLVYNQKNMPKKAISRWEASMKQSYGTTSLHLTTEFYERSMAQSTQESEDVTVTGYSELRQFVETEHLFLLRRSWEHWFFVAKDGIENNTQEALRAFINQKMGG